MHACTPGAHGVRWFGGFFWLAGLVDWAGLGWVVCMGRDGAGNAGLFSQGNIIIIIWSRRLGRFVALGMR